MYGRVITGGKQMTKGLTKGINDKLDQLEDKREKRESLANTVKGAFATKNLSNNHWNDIDVGQRGNKMKAGKQVKNV
jgi:hypothetical protein